jgi:cysteine desulfuration protein SufE
MLPDLQTIIDNFELLEDWEDRYRYVIELGQSLPPFPDEARIERNKVEGCASQVWLIVNQDEKGLLRLQGDSDAHIVRGLVALVIAFYDGQPVEKAKSEEIAVLFDRIGLNEHLSTQRANGVRAMIERIKGAAREMDVNL